MANRGRHLRELRERAVGLVTVQQEDRGLQSATMTSVNEKVGRSAELERACRYTQDGAPAMAAGLTEKGLRTNRSGSVSTSM